MESGTSGAGPKWTYTLYQMECLTVLRVRPLNWKLAASLQAVVLAFDVTAYCMKVMQ